MEEKKGEGSWWKGLVLTAVTAVTAGIAVFFNQKKSKQERKKEKEINNSYKSSTSNTDVDNRTQCTLCKESDMQLDHFHKSPMSEDEYEELKPFIQTCADEAIKTAYIKRQFNNLLKCDMPLSDLCRVKNNPTKFRGIVRRNGKISKQASFSEAGLHHSAPLLIREFLSFLTSQHYLHEINNKLNNIIKIIEEVRQDQYDTDISTLKSAFKGLVELDNKSTYDAQDKGRACRYSDKISQILEKYRSKLSRIDVKDLSIDGKMIKLIDKANVSFKVKRLQDINYFDFLEIVMDAEYLFFFATMIELQIAEFLRNEEDMHIYANRLDAQKVYFFKYKDQFEKIKHSVLKYIESKKDEAWIKGDITEKLKEQSENFDKAEKMITDIQKLCNVEICIKAQEDGTLTKYIGYSNA